METENDILIISEEEAGERLDKILARRFIEVHSRSYFQYLIDEHLVLLNGEPVKKRIKPVAGDEVEVQFAALPGVDLIPEAIPLTIVYEDDHILVINKPVGMVVHPAPGHWSGTFVNALLYHCQHLPVPEGTLRPGIVHRLDKETSGLLVAAKTLDAQKRLIELFATRKVYKEYLAVCGGHVADGIIEAPIGRHPVLRKEMAVVPHGRPACSICKTLGYNDKLSVVQVVITTGRSHQIRVHLKHKGHPVLGDTLYGSASLNQAFGVHHQLLHAAVLRFPHPITHEPMEFKAPTPEEMQRIIKKIIPSS